MSNEHDEAAGPDGADRDDANEDAGVAGAASDGAPRRKRRRRRGRNDRDGGAGGDRPESAPSGSQASGAHTAAPPAVNTSSARGAARPERGRGRPEADAVRGGSSTQGGPGPRRGDRPERPDRNDGNARQDTRDNRGPGAPTTEQARRGPVPTVSLRARGPLPADASGATDSVDGTDLQDPDEVQQAWGQDDDSPASAITLTSQWPSDSAADNDIDPTSLGARLLQRVETQVAHLVAVRFVHAGRLVWFDAGDLALQPGDRVIVDSERGPRLATVATLTAPNELRDRPRPVLRRATATDLEADEREGGRLRELLARAKEAAKNTALPVKVFRVEAHPGKYVVYYTTDEQRLDARALVSRLGTVLGGRVDVRGVGARDEAKLVGGIGSCGQELCCSTFLPEFVPVSIKMAKDQGMVLAPSKVAGQCGRLKCCLVYEQSMYAEMRKGLPKLGKRVVTERGEGRVTEVDVLRQRIRVSYGPGDVEVHAATEVRPMFPSGQARGGAADADGDSDEADLEPSATAGPGDAATAKNFLPSD